MTTPTTDPAAHPTPSVLVIGGGITGLTTQVWDVDLHDDRGRAIAVCRVTLAVVSL